VGHAGLLYAALSSVWTAHDPGWYARLAKPSLQPPDVVFGGVWPLNSLALLAVGAWFTRSDASTGVCPTALMLAASVVAALACRRSDTGVRRGRSGARAVARPMATCRPLHINRSVEVVLSEA